MSLLQAVGSVALQTGFSGSIPLLLTGAVVGGALTWWFLKQSGSKKE